MSSTERERIQQALPGYEIGEELGRGAWGVVLAGRHRRLGREVAIKQLPANYASDEEVAARFLREAQMAASLDHPHIVPVYDYVEDDGLGLIVMERCSSTVHERHRSGGLNEQEAIAAALATCSALAYAHERGVLHRDIKPANLLIDRNGVVKLGDFGIARAVDGNVRLTATGMVIGTPAYMSPEQAGASDLAPASDVYSLGVVLYELLARRSPFNDTSSVAALVRQHLLEPPVPLAETAPHVPEAVTWVVERALAKSPQDRWATAMQFGVALGEASAATFGVGWARKGGHALLAAPEIVAATEADPASRTAPFPSAGSAHTGPPTVQAPRAPDGEIARPAPPVRPGNATPDPAASPGPAFLSPAVEASPAPPPLHHSPLHQSPPVEASPGPASPAVASVPQYASPPPTPTPAPGPQYASPGPAQAHQAGHQAVASGEPAAGSGASSGRLAVIIGAAVLALIAVPIALVVAFGGDDGGTTDTPAVGVTTTAAADGSGSAADDGAGSADSSESAGLSPSRESLSGDAPSPERLILATMSDVDFGRDDEQVQAGVDLALDEIAAGGGVFGGSIDHRLVTYDGFEADDGFRTVVASGASALIGPVDFFLADDAEQQMAASGIVRISPTDFSDRDALGTNAFRTRPPNSALGEAATQLVPVDARTVAVIRPDNSFTSDAPVLSRIEQSLAARGVTTVEVPFDDDAPQAGVDAVLAASPDAIILNGFITTDDVYGPLIDAGIGPQAVPYIVAGAQGSSFRLDEGQLAGVQGVLLDFDLGDELEERLTAASLDPEAAYAYDATIIAALAAEATNSTDPADLAAAIPMITGDGGEVCTAFAACMALLDEGLAIDYDGIAGPYEFGSNGEPTLVRFVVTSINAGGTVETRQLQTFTFSG
ncbi:MAG: protein kinase [Actinomycetota bacterium]